MAQHMLLLGHEGNVLVRAHLEFCIQIWDAQHKKNIDVLEGGPEESHKDDKRGGACLLQRQVLRDGIVWHGEDSGETSLQPSST